MEIGWIRKRIGRKERQILRAKVKLARLEAEKQILTETLSEQAQLEEYSGYEFAE